MLIIVSDVFCNEAVLTILKTMRNTFLWSGEVEMKTFPFFPETFWG